MRIDNFNIRGLDKLLFVTLKWVVVGFKIYRRLCLFIFIFSQYIFSFLSIHYKKYKTRRY